MGHILLVEDKKDLRDNWRGHLEENHHTCDVAENGRIAYDLIRKLDAEYDVVVTDLHMPIMSGRDLLEEVRYQLELRTPLILVTGYDYMYEGLGVLRQGAFSILRKPFVPQELLETVERALKLRAVFVEMRRLRERVDELTRVRDAILRRNEELFASARLDPLTGLPNRLQMDALLHVFHANALRYKSRFALAFCDIDNFGRVNKKHGHPAGDAVILAVTEAIKGCCRDGDSLFRWGGDELVLVLSDQDGSGARLAMQRIVEEVATVSVPVDDQGKAEPVTISVGVAAVEPGEARTIQEMIKEANEHMRAAKEAVGNRVHPRASPS